MHAKIFSLLLFLLASCLLLTGCKKELSLPSDKNISYYPYLAESDYILLHRKNQIGVIPDTIAIPPHEIGTLEYELNSNNWWGGWPAEGAYLNAFIAEKIKTNMGCGPFKEGMLFTLKPGIYVYRENKISVAAPIIWQLKTNVESICRTATRLSTKYYIYDSLYWERYKDKDN